MLRLCAANQSRAYQLSLTQLFPLLPPPLDDLNQLIGSLLHRHEARRLVDLLPSEIIQTSTVEVLLPADDL